MDGKWVRQPKAGAGVVIFVHGILSSGEACWKHSNGTYWPTLLTEDQALSDILLHLRVSDGDEFASIMKD